MKIINPFLSVVIPNYNNARFIDKCLDSVLNQSYRNLEIIVCDDASNDGSKKIIKKYEKNFPDMVKGYYSIKNQGVAKARHEAILYAKGEYITTLDSDDYYFDSLKLKKEMDLIRKYQEKGFEIIAFSNIILVNEEGKIIGPQWPDSKIKEGNIFREVIARSCMIPRDFIMKKEVYFKVGGYDSQFLIFEDWDLKIRLAEKFKFYYTGLSGIAYRRHKGGLSQAPIGVQIKWMKEIFKKNIILSKPVNQKLLIISFETYINNVIKANKPGLVSIR